MCVHRETGQRREENWERDGSICSPAIMRQASDNILVLNWYRLTKYPDQEERAAVLSCLYAMPAPTAPSCTVTIWSILIQMSSPLGLCPNLIFNTVCLSLHVCVCLYLFFQFTSKDHFCCATFKLVSFLDITLNSKTEDYWFHTRYTHKKGGLCLFL